jgi:hypothetical protein
MKHLYVSDSTDKQFFITQNFIKEERINICSQYYIHQNKGKGHPITGHEGSIGGVEV